MAKLNSILKERFKKKEPPKMSDLAKRTSIGQLTPFSGVFGIPRVEEKDRTKLTELLNKYSTDHEEIDIPTDLSFLLEITAEVNAINNQAAILHGERIKKAQEILKKYREGAFSAWLLTTYGNRQTPYNFLQYYEFYTKMPKTLHSTIESMPRQAIYTLASREGNLEQKEEIVRNYKGEGKQEVISLIRSRFPLNENDKRKENLAIGSIKQLKQIAMTFQHVTLTLQQKKEVLLLLESINLNLNKEK